MSQLRHLQLHAHTGGGAQKSSFGCWKRGGGRRLAYGAEQRHLWLLRHKAGEGNKGPVSHMSLSKTCCTCSTKIWVTHFAMQIHFKPFIYSSLMLSCICSLHTLQYEIGLSAYRLVLLVWNGLCMKWSISFIRIAGCLSQPTGAPQSP